MFLFYTMNMYITCICPLGAISLTRLAKAIAKKRRFSFARIVHLLFWLCLFVFFFFQDIVRVLQKCVRIENVEPSVRRRGISKTRNRQFKYSTISFHRIYSFFNVTFSKLFPPKFSNTFSQFFSRNCVAFEVSAFKMIGDNTSRH